MAPAPTIDDNDHFPVPEPLDADEEVLDNLYVNVKRRDLRASLAYILALQNASLDDSGTGLSVDAIERLRNPPDHAFSIDDDPELKLAIRLYLALNNADDDYTKAASAIREYNNTITLPSLRQIKSLVSQITGVEEMKHDMCVNTCVGFTGPFESLDHCPECSEPRYNQEELEATGAKVPRRQFSTIPVGQQLQAIHRSPEGAVALQYRNIQTQQIFDELNQSNGSKESYDDFFDGSQYLEAVNEGKIKPEDHVLMFSTDGAQLFKNKQSDCWMSIWVVLDRSPETRYQKRYVLPGVVIPGPNKPKNLDSFLFPSFHHLSAIQQEGLKIWDASRNIIYTSNPFLALGTADGPALAYLNGFVGHHGKYGCRLHCGMKGRHKAGCPHYFAAHKKPPDFNVEGCDHPDIDVRNLGTCSTEVYWKDLVYVLLSVTDSQYRQRRLETGISKPSLFLGFQSAHIFGVPTCFGSDIMHLLSLNIPDLLIPLWRGTFECDKDDNKSTWTWAVLVGDVWKEFGMLVEESTSHLPGCFDRPPRNPEKKINSGYKAWEFTLLLYGLCVVFLHGVLPDQYWIHFCKLVRAVRIISQHHITQNELCVAARLFVEFIEEFEDLYYQRRIERIHFMRQSIHALGHYATEVQSKGPLICASQWTMERTIGNLVIEMRQPSKPYENLSQRAFRRAQHNALMSIFPVLDPDYSKPPFPKWSKDIGGGYALLKQQERHRHATTIAEGQVIRLYLQNYHLHSPEFDHFNIDGSFQVIRWARLRLPNGQTSRSLFSTRERRQNARRARNAKVCCFKFLVPSYQCSFYCVTAFHRGTCIFC